MGETSVQSDIIIDTGQSGSSVEIPDDHYNPSVRMVHVPKLENGSCGFNLSRSKWDPYPWVSFFFFI